jgi:predicted phage baseplate assembly protein
MPLPAPNLDDRRFQDLVDDAKRLVQQRCPEWTDHNVSDPGVTLIETFAYMVDQLLYRLNRVPDRTYVKFLELIGERLFPPVAAEVPLTFWLSAPQQTTITIPEASQASTMRSEAEDPVIFTTAESLGIVPCSLSRTATQSTNEDTQDTTRSLVTGTGFFCFTEPPNPGDIVYFGLSNAVPSCVLSLRVTCHIEGIGVDPNDPPIVWEAWNGQTWLECEVERDTTGGLNRPGEILIHIPKTHTESVIVEATAGWVRARLVPAEEGQAFYTHAPQIDRVEASTVGGTVGAVNATPVDLESIGISDGVPGQRFPLQRDPVAHAGPETAVQVAEDGWQTWTRVPHFADSEPEDRHFVLDEVASEVVFGPAIRLADGSLKQYGAVPPKGAAMRLSRYRVGGGARGNVAPRTVSVLKSSIPFVSRVENRRFAAGGQNPETIENAKERVQIALRTRHRAVTADDYEYLALEAAPEIARARCLPVAPDGEDAGTVRLLLVPHVDESQLELEIADLMPQPETLERVREYLDERRCVGSRLVVAPASYQGITIVARLLARPHYNADELAATATDVLYAHFHPLHGGPTGTGWPFGQNITLGQVYALLQQVPGCAFVEEAHLFAANPITGERGPDVHRVEVVPKATVFSHEHQIRVDVPEEDG